MDLWNLFQLLMTFVAIKVLSAFGCDKQNMWHMSKDTLCIGRIDPHKSLPVNLWANCKSIVALRLVWLVIVQFP